MEWLAVQVAGQHLCAVDVAREHGSDTGRNIRADDVVGIGEHVAVNLSALDGVVNQKQRCIGAHVAAKPCSPPRGGNFVGPSARRESLRGRGGNRRVRIDRS